MAIEGSGCLRPAAAMIGLVASILSILAFFGIKEWRDVGNSESENGQPSYPIYHGYTAPQTSASPAGHPRLIIKPSEVDAGDTFTLYGTGFPAKVSVTVTLGSKFVADAMASDSGSFTLHRKMVATGCDHYPERRMVKYTASTEDQRIQVSAAVIFCAAGA